MRKLEAEASIGVLAALVAGFALAMLPGIDLKPDTDAARAAPATTFGECLVYAHVMSLSLVAGAGMLNVVSTSTMYWAGMKIFSKRKGSLENDLEVFDLWWDGIKGRRQNCRHAFIYSVPLFLFSTATCPCLWSQHRGVAVANALIMLVCAAACFDATRRLVLVGAPKQDSAKKAKAKGKGKKD
eukprot:SAG22_NODE_1832_length_3477_cov_3.782416_2_plen_184_part_00